MNTKKWPSYMMVLFFIASLNLEVVIGIKSNGQIDLPSEIEKVVIDSD